MSSIRCPHCNNKIYLPLPHRIVFTAVMTALNDANWVQTKAAEMLGVSYPTLRAWVKRYAKLGVDIPTRTVLDMSAWVQEVLGSDHNREGVGDV